MNAETDHIRYHALGDIAQWQDIPQVISESAFEQLYAALDGQDCFVLIDPYLGEPEGIQGQMVNDPPHSDPATLAALRGRAWQCDCYPIDHEPLGLDVSQSPYLLHLKAQDTSQYQRLLDVTLSMAQTGHWQAVRCASGAQHVGGWLTLQGAADGKALAASLGARMTIGRHDLASTCLRLADPRVLELLHHIDAVPLAPEPAPALNWAAQLPGIAQWVYPDFAFGLKTIVGGKGNLNEDNLDIHYLQWRVLEQAQAINMTLLRWQQSHGKPFAKPYNRIWRALQAAQQAGLADPESQAEHAAQLLQQHLV